MKRFRASLTRPQASSPLPGRAEHDGPAACPKGCGGRGLGSAGRAVDTRERCDGDEPRSRREALALSHGERAALAADLLASLDETASDKFRDGPLGMGSGIENRAVSAITGESPNGALRDGSATDR